MRLPMRLIERLAARPAGPIDAARVAVVVAHPDDETIACGGLLARLDGVNVIVATDGAPQDGRDARRAGFATIADYAEARARELEAALGLAGIGPDAIRRLGFPDQGAAQALARLTRAIQTLIDGLGIETVLTHAYEGGHPDHDAVAFAVAAAAERARRPIEVIEMPLYHEGADGSVVQRFTDVGPCEVVQELDAASRALKARMLAAHATQRETLQPFGTATERFRPARPRNFHALPNRGRVAWAERGFGLDPRLWPVMVRRALAELDQGPAQGDGDAWSTGGAASLGAPGRGPSDRNGGGPRTEQPRTAAWG